MLPCLLPQTPLLQRPLANVVRALLALGWWALAMTAWTTNQDEGVKEAVQVVLKVWACVTLFMTANLLKTLLAKLLSSKFNKESHSRKIQDSLVKEYYLHMMFQPRERKGQGGSEDGGGEGGGGGDSAGAGGKAAMKNSSTAFGSTIASSMVVFFS